MIGGRLTCISSSVDIRVCVLVHQVFCRYDSVCRECGILGMKGYWQLRGG